MDLYEDDYLWALSEINIEGFNEWDWLCLNLDLYKTTLNWPKNLPPIPRSNLIKGSLREKFHATYKEILREFKERLFDELSATELEYRLSKFQ